MVYGRMVTIYEHADAARMLQDLNPSLGIGDAQEIVRKSPSFGLINDSMGRLRTPVWTHDQIEVISQEWRKKQPAAQLLEQVKKVVCKHYWPDGTHRACVCSVGYEVEKVVEEFLKTHTIVGIE